MDSLGTAGHEEMQVSFSLLCLALSQELWDVSEIPEAAGEQGLWT